jgi:dolichyl-phosphate beta-glucosyltransferase
MSEPSFSVVVPAYNEADAIGETLSAVSAYFAATGLRYEILVIDDGSTDDTAQIVEKFSSSLDPFVRIIRSSRNEGKGGAVRRGVQEARGEVIAFIDADLPYRAQNLGDAIALVHSGATDIAIGARDLRSSQTDESYPLIRRFMGRTFSLFVRALLVRGISDTQCGLKAFSRPAAKLLFAESKLNGFGFDFEVLFLARKYGFRIERLPVAMSHRHASKVRLVRDSLRMLLDIFRVRHYDRAMAYRSARRCPVCFSANVETLTQLKQWVVRRCARCNCRYLASFPSHEELEKLYDDAYFDRDDSLARGYGRQNERAQARTNQRRAAMIRRATPARGRVLEVGAGEGAVGRLLGSDFEYVGIDLSTDAVRRARNAGLEVFRSTLDGFVNLGAAFDTIASFHVFEHLPDPHDALARMKDLLKPGGSLILVTPDTESLLCLVSGDRWVSYKFPEHLILYSRSALVELLENSGFEILSIGSDFEYCDHPFLLSRLESLSQSVASAAKAGLFLLPDPLPVTSGSIRIVARRRSGFPGGTRSIRTIEATHAR